MVEKLKTFLFCYFIFFFVFSWEVHAQLKLSIKGGNFTPITIGVAPFNSEDLRAKAVIGKVEAIVMADLNGSGFFSCKEDLYSPLSGAKNSSSASSFSPEKAFLRFSCACKGEEIESVSFDLWDVTQGVWGKKQQFFFKDNKSFRSVAHNISDAIYTKMTGEAPYFNSRIVFVDVGEDGERRLAIMDQDGSNLSYLTEAKSLILMPHFSADGESIIYISYLNGMPKVFVQNIKKRTVELIGAIPKTAVSPRFSPDNKKIIMSLLEDDGAASLYELNLSSGSLVQLSAGSSIDMSGCYSPDGRNIVFASDREGGLPQLFVMSLDTREVRRISEGEGGYGSPVWSPFGDYIAFSKQNRLTQNSSIGIMEANGSGERILVKDGGRNEVPSWAPNGRVLMFSKRLSGRMVKLYKIDVFGRGEQMVNTPNSAFDSAWSPLLSGIAQKKAVGGE